MDDEPETVFKRKRISHDYFLSIFCGHIIDYVRPIQKPPPIPIHFFSCKFLHEKTPPTSLDFTQI